MTRWQRYCEGVGRNTQILRVLEYFREKDSIAKGDDVYTCGSRQCERREDNPKPKNHDLALGA